MASKKKAKSAAASNGFAGKVSSISWDAEGVVKIEVTGKKDEARVFSADAAAPSSSLLISVAALAFDRRQKVHVTSTQDGAAIKAFRIGAKPRSAKPKAATRKVKEPPAAAAATAPAA